MTHIQTILCGVVLLMIAATCLSAPIDINVRARREASDVATKLEDYELGLVIGYLTTNLKLGKALNVTLMDLEDDVLRNSLDITCTLHSSFKNVLEFFNKTVNETVYELESNKTTNEMGAIPFIRATAEIMENSTCNFLKANVSSYQSENSISSLTCGDLDNVVEELDEICTLWDFSQLSKALSKQENVTAFRETNEMQLAEWISKHNLTDNPAVKALNITELEESTLEPIAITE